MLFVPPVATCALPARLDIGTILELATVNATRFQWKIVGRLFPAQAAHAAASYQLTPETGSSSRPWGYAPTSHVAGPGRPVRSLNRAIASLKLSSRPPSTNGSRQYFGSPYPPASRNFLYARFVTKVFFDMGLVSFREPFRALFTQGMITRGGVKMSKSKKNTVAPDELIARYGTDTGRVYTMFIGPPEKDSEWSDRGVEGAYRFLNRVWRLGRTYGGLVRESTTTARPEIASATAREIRYAAHTALARVTRDFESFHNNTAVAAMMELVNTLIQAGQREAAALEPGVVANPTDVRWAMGEALSILIFVLAPIAPHVSEEMWSQYGDDGSAGTIFRLRWPEPDASALAVETETLVVQVNGKLRARLELPTSLSPADVEREARDNPRIAALLEGHSLSKVIHVPHRLINLVVS